jgi:hypothetical protein
VDIDVYLAILAILSPIGVAVIGLIRYRMRMQELTAARKAMLESEDPDRRACGERLAKMLIESQGRRPVLVLPWGKPRDTG